MLARELMLVLAFVALLMGFALRCVYLIERNSWRRYRDGKAERARVQQLEAYRAHSRQLAEQKGVLCE